MKKRGMQLSLGIGISAAALVLLLRILDLRAVATALTMADSRWVPLAVAVYLLAMGVRSVLWRRLLPVKLPTGLIFQVVIVGFTISYLMPLRVGEIARAYLMKRWCGVEYGTTLASLVAERVLDGLVVAGVLLAGLLFVATPTYVVLLGLGIGLVFLVLAAMLLVASWRADAVVKLTAYIVRPLPWRVRRLTLGLARAFADGLEPLRNWRALPGLVALSLAGWLCQFAVFYLLLLAFRMPGAIPMALVGGSVANFATLLPSAPGFVGTFDAAIIKLLVDIQGANLATATAYALVVHTVLVVPVVVLGSAILWRSDLSLGHMMAISFRSKRTSVATVAPPASAAINTPALGL
jgi:glycosyltransferase 2 family protein